MLIGKTARRKIVYQAPMPSIHVPITSHPVAPRKSKDPLHRWNLPKDVPQRVLVLGPHVIRHHRPAVHRHHP